MERQTGKSYRYYMCYRTMAQKSTAACCRLGVAANYTAFRSLFPVSLDITIAAAKCYKEIGGKAHFIMPRASPWGWIPAVQSIWKAAASHDIRHMLRVLLTWQHPALTRLASAKLHNTSSLHTEPPQSLKY